MFDTIFTNKSKFCLFDLFQILVFIAKPSDISFELHALNHISSIPPLSIHLNIRIVRNATFWWSI